MTQKNITPMITEQATVSKKVIIEMKNGDLISDEIERANAHPAGDNPFHRRDYIKKFDQLTEHLISTEERNRFINLVESLPNLSAKEIQQLNVQVKPEFINNETPKTGIF